MLKLAFASFLLLSMSVVFANTNGDKILHDIDGLVRPKLDQSKASDENYRAQYNKDMAAYTEQRNTLILELYKEDPTNPKAGDLMKSRWMSLGGGLGDRNAAKADIEKVLSENPPAPIREAADYCEVAWDWLGIRKDPNSEPNVRQEVEGFVAKYPGSDDAAQLLWNFSFSATEEEKPAIYREFLGKFPNYRFAPQAQGALRRMDALGKPFDLSFTDAVSGQSIDVASMKGKVVLIDFWATWCGPCKAEMPTVNDYYQKYHDKGVEIVGVSLDQPESKGGLTKLKDYVAQNQIPWPMYYQGNFWDSKFSSSWGIMSIPTMFVIDKQGNFQGTIDPRDATGFEAKLNKYLNQ